MTPNIQWISKFKLFYALTSHMANHLDLRKIAEAFNNHWHYLHLAQFLVQCTANLNRLGNEEAAKLAFRH